jgi:S1-C subfamily serine protease
MAAALGYTLSAAIRHRHRIIKIDGELARRSRRLTSALRMGEWVCAIGNPLG